MATKTKPCPEQSCSGACAAAPMAADLTPAELAAVARVGLQAAKTRDELTPGLHRIDATVRLSGAVIVGENQPGGTVTETPKAEGLLAILFAGASPKSRGKMLDHLKARYQDWIAGAVESQPELDQRERGLAADVFGALSRQVERPGKRGNVSGAIECRLIKRHEAKK